MSSILEENKILKDEVRRLSDVLRRYREADPSLPTPEATADYDPVWLADTSTLPPLLEEYDTIIQEQEALIQASQEKILQLQEKHEETFRDNKKLTHELKAALQNSLLQSDESRPVAVLDDETVMTDLQQQLHNALEEKKSVAAMYNLAQNYVDELTSELQKLKSSYKWQAIEEQTLQVETEYKQTLAVMTNKIDDLQQQTRTHESEMMEEKRQKRDLQSRLDSLISRLSDKDNADERAAVKHEAYETKIGDLVGTITQQTQRLHALEIELKQEKTARVVAQQQLSETSRRNTELTGEGVEIKSHMREELNAMEQAMLQKDEALVRERQLAAEVERLRDAMNTLVDEAGQRTRKEVDAVRQQCNTNIERLAEEVQALELELHDKHCQLERVQRDKKTLETELETLSREGNESRIRDTQSYDELVRRSCEAERDRDTANRRTEELTQKIQKLEMQQREERGRLQQELSQVNSRLSSLQSEFEHVNQERVKTTAENDSLQRKLSAARLENEQTQLRSQKELNSLDLDIKRRLRQQETEYQATEDSYRQTMQELRQMLANQQRMSAKWREECQTITETFERKLKSQREQTKQAKDRTDELIVVIKEARNKTEQSESLLSEYSRHIKRLEGRVRDAENRAEQSIQQISKQLAAERSQRKLMSAGDG